MLRGYCEAAGACIWAAGCIFVCFFLTVVVPSVAALAGVLTGTAAKATAKQVSVKRRMENLGHALLLWVDGTTS